MTGGTLRRSRFSKILGSKSGGTDDDLSASSLGKLKRTLNGSQGSGVTHQGSDLSASMRTLQSDLAYNEPTVKSNGTAVDREEKVVMRAKNGFCETCVGAPVWLYHVKTSRINPLHVRRVPRTVSGESYEGKCLKCHPEVHPNYENTQAGRMNRESLRSGRTSGISRDSSSAPQTRAHESSSSMRHNKSSRRSSEGSLTLQDLLRPVTEMQSNQDGENNLSFSSLPRLSAHSPPVTPSPSRGSLVPSEVEFNYAHSGGHESPSLASCVSSLASGGVSTIGIDDIAFNDQAGAYLHVSRPRVTDDDDDFGAAQPRRPPPQRSGTNPFAPTNMHGVASSRNDLIDSNYRDPVPFKRGARTGELRSTDNGEDTPVHQSTEGTSVGIVVEQMRALTRDMSECDIDLFIEIIAGAMTEHDGCSGVQEFCLNGLTRACKDDKAKKRSIALSGALNPIMQSMSSCPSSIAVQVAACELIRSLAIVSNNRIALIRAGACQSVAAALIKFTSYEVLVEDAIAALRSLSFESEARELLQSLGAPKYTARAMAAQRKSADIQRDGCALLSNCAVDIKKQSVAVVSLDEIEVVSEAMKTHRDNPTVVSSACFTLKNLTHEPENCRMLRQIPNIMGRLEELLEEGGLSEGSITDVSEILERIHISLAADMSMNENARNDVVQQFVLSLDSLEEL